jgi:small subunit ribosomal protein S12
MVRISQLVHNPRKKKLLKNRSGTKLLANPQKKAVCLKLLTIAPKKPNSANRRVAKVALAQTGLHLTVKIVGEKHSLQQHSSVLLQGGRCRDLIGVRLKAIRGKYDLMGVVGRKSSLSLYGVRKN